MADSPSISLKKSREVLPEFLDVIKRVKNCNGNKMVKNVKCIKEEGLEEKYLYLYQRYSCLSSLG